MNVYSKEAGLDARVIGEWRKSSFTGDNGGCFEFASSTIGVAVRDSKLGEASPVLHFTPFEMECMLNGAKSGEFDDFA